MKTTDGKVYTTWGPTRGGCGKVYGTLAAAIGALDKDQRGARRQGGYSDREVREIASVEQATQYDTTRGPGRRVVDETLGAELARAVAS